MILAHLQGEGGLQLCPTSPWPQKKLTPLNGDLTISLTLPHLQVI